LSRTDTAGRYNLRQTPAALAMLVLAAALLVMAAEEAGFRVTTWGPVALLALALLTITVVAVGAPPRPSRAAALALGLFAAYTLWSYLSILWADRQGPALDGANRTLLYLLILIVFASWPLGARAGRLVLAVLGLGIAALGLVELVRVHLSDQPVSFFLGGRLVEPAGYVNANVALWTLGLLACLALAADRNSPLALGGAALGGSGVLAALALLGQSRGWLIALPFGLIALVAVAPGRARMLAVIAGVAAATALASSRLLPVHDDFSRARLDGLIADALAATIVSAVVLALAGTALLLLARNRAAGRPERRRERRTPNRGALAGIAAGLLVALVAVLVLAGVPGRVSDAWADFKQGGEPETGSSRFTSLGTYRYDFWRVAWDVFEDNPVAGIGAENYQEEYLRRGTSFEQPRYAHSLELGVLSQTGIVGALLLFGAIGAALVAALARRRRAGPALAWLSAGALGMFAYWLAHASVDWLWEFPALGGVAFAALGLALAPAPPKEIAGRRPLSRGAVLVGAIALLACALALAAPVLAERSVQRALDTWRSDPDAAFDQLDRADALNPLSDRARVVGGAIAVELGRLDRAEAEFRSALEREPDEAYALLELGAISGQRGDRARSLAFLRRARALRPRDDAVRYAFEQVAGNRPLDVSDVNARILSRARARLQRAP
jgi:tetratricopeptide (TPR) repeat protein